MNEKERCRAEIAVALGELMRGGEQEDGAYVGLTDWQCELRLIEAEERKQMESELEHLRRQRDELHAANNRSLEEIRRLRAEIDYDQGIIRAIGEKMVRADQADMVQDFMIMFGRHISFIGEALPEASEAEQRAFVHYANALDEHEIFPVNTPRGLRVKLLLEEMHEYLTAESQSDIVGIADALADMLYIIHGTALTYGIPINEIFAAVHESNMAKLGPDGKPIYRESDGKVIKPEGWQAPDIAAILRKHGWEGAAR